MAANTTIDTLEVKISANARSAVDSLKSLANALKGVKTALTGVDKDGLKASDHISKSLNEMNGALNTITTSGIKRIQKLANGLNDYADALKKVKAIGSTAGITKGIDALGGNSAAKQIQETKEALGLATKEDTAVMTGGSGNTYSPEDLKKMGVFSRDAAKGVEKLKKEVGAAGQKAKASSGLFGKFVKSVGRIMLYRAIRSAIKAVAEAFSEGLKNAYMFSKQSESFTRLAETLDRLKSITAQMVNQLGAFWGEVKQFVLPAIEWIVEKVRYLAERLTELFAALNGSDVYLQAQYVSKEWETATDSVKKYKQQLLGLDELNNLSTQKDSGKEKENYAENYKEVPVSNNIKSIAEGWNKLKDKITGALTEIELALGGFMIGVGAALLFSGANIPLGLGLIIAGGFMSGHAAKEEWDKIKDNVEKSVGAIELVLGGLLLGVGAVLTFSGAAPKLGIGLMIAGAASLGVGAAKWNWDRMEKKTQKAVTAIELALGGLLLGLGAVLTFSGAAPALGIGLMIGGATALGDAAVEASLNWNDIKTSVHSAVGGIETLLGGLLLGIGGAIAFSGANVPLGIALMAAGAVGLVEGIKNVSWDSLEPDIQTAVTKISLVLEGASIVVGGLLTLAGRPEIGIPLLAIGAAGLVSQIAINWNSQNADVIAAISSMTALLSGGALLLGCLLTFTGVAPQIGIPLIAIGCAGMVTAIAINWDAIFKPIKAAWERFVNWWETTVEPEIDRKMNKIKGLVEGVKPKDPSKTEVTTPITGSKIQLNPLAPLTDNVIEDIEISANETSTETAKRHAEKVWQPVRDVISDTIDDGRTMWNGFISDIKNSAVGEVLDLIGIIDADRSDGGGGRHGFAMGGIPSRGSMFFAGEAGPEYIGRIGNSSAVANTGQMTDAIYRAAYMGMSQALKENGGMNGFEPATTDDLFIAMKKKSSAYTKRTGQPAFG